MAGVARPSTFSDLFNDVSLDPFLQNGSYADLLAPFTIAPGEGNVTPAAVRHLLAASATQRLPVALLALIEDRLTPVYLPFRRDRAMGMPPHDATDDKMFGFEGELVGSQGSLVHIPDDWFHLSRTVCVADVATIRGLLAAEPGRQVVGPFVEGDANVSSVRTRLVTAIPNRYASLFLAQPGGITPRYYFDTILPVIEADGMADTCTPLTRFCQVAITTGGPNETSLIRVDAPVPPRRHVPLLAQAEAILTHHLPGLRRVAQPEVNLQPLINTIVAGQQQRQQEQAVARLEREAKDNATIGTWLGNEHLNRLLKYCGIATEQQLPPLWTALAKAPAKDRLTILEGAVANEFLALGAVYEQYTPSLFLLTQVTSLKWGMLNPDALDSGSLGNAFLFTDSDIEVAQSINRQIDFIQQGGATPSYADAQILLKAKITLPGPDDTIRCVLRMHAVFRALLPPDHPLLSFMAAHHAAMKAYDPGWTTYATYVPALRGLKGVYHLQWLSLRLTNYFRMLDRNVPNVACPDPHEIIDRIQEQRQWEPILTETFILRYNVRSFLALHAFGAGGGSRPPLPSLAGSSASVSSGLTAPSLATAPGGSANGTVAVTQKKGEDTRVENPDFNGDLFGTYKTSALKAKSIRDRVKSGAIPPLPVSKLNAAAPMCLAWHSKGVCNKNCPSVADHVRYSADEYEPLVAWCRDHGYKKSE